MIVNIGFRDGLIEFAYYTIKYQSYFMGEFDTNSVFWKHKYTYCGPAMIYYICG